MSNSVSFDQEGVWGPAMMLIFQTPNNDEDLKEVSKLLQKNYTKMSATRIKPDHRSEFCGNLLYRINTQKPTTPLKILRSGFFSTMQSVKETELHERVKKILIPSMLIQTKPDIPQVVTDDPRQEEINEHLAWLVEGYLSDEVLTDHCDCIEKLGSDQSIKDLRGYIGGTLYNKVRTKDFTENDLNALLIGLEYPIDEKVVSADNPEEVAKFIKMYQDLFAKAGDYEKMFCQQVSKSLHTTFRSKFFPTVNASSSSE